MDAERTLQDIAEKLGALVISMAEMKIQFANVAGQLQLQINGLTDLTNRQTIIERNIAVYEQRLLSVERLPDTVSKVESYCGDSKERLDKLETRLDEANKQVERNHQSIRWLVMFGISLITVVIGGLSFVLQHIGFH